MNRLRRGWWVAAVCLGAAGYFVFAWVDAARSSWGMADLYWEYYPNMVYAARQLWRGGQGLLWNPLQNCGQPFFANSSTALLYPPNWFFLLLPPDAALLAVTAIDLTIGGVGAYLLARELGARPTAALCGALAFELGNEVLDTSMWLPFINASIVWLPAALWCVERILKQPSLRAGLGLAVVLALALLNGFPQPLYLGYQLIVLRVAWEVFTGHVRYLWPTLASIALGLVLPPLLAAVHFVPGAEMAGLSVRAGARSLPEIIAAHVLTWEELRRSFGARASRFNPITIGPFLVALASPFSSTRRRVAVFYGLCAMLFFLLAFGPATPLFEAYLAFPLARTFRGPSRMLWITGLCLSILTALGAEYLMAQRRADPAWSRRVLAVVLAIAILGLQLLSPTGLRAGDWLLGLVVTATALWPPAARTARSAVVTAVVVLSLLAFNLRYLANGPWALRAAPSRILLLPSAQLRAAESVFSWLQRNTTAHDRAYIMEQRARLHLIPKSASLFDFRSVHDYEPVPTLRTAEYQVMMRTGQPMRGLNSFYFHVPRGLPLPSLLNLAAARYLLIDSAHERLAAVARTYQFRYGDAGVDVYENPDALPRAFFVPRVSVVPDAQVLLDRLAHGAERPTDAALVEEPPPSGFVGDPGEVAAPPVEFVTDEPERIVLRVHAPRRGFVHIADQYYPGWVATVGDKPAAILRSNFLFRLVEVPAGDSMVELRYQPTSLRIGAIVSFLSITAAVIAARRSRGSRDVLYFLTSVSSEAQKSKS